MEITKRHLVTAGTLLAVIIVAVVVDRWVVTGKERVVRQVELMAEACGDGNAQALLSHVSPDYNDGTFNKLALNTMALTFFKLHGPVDAKPRHTVVVMNNDHATADVTIFTRSHSGQIYGTSQWTMDFEKNADGEWKMVSLLPVKIAQVEVSGWGDVLRMGSLR